MLLEIGDVIEYLNPKIIPSHYDTTSNNDKYLCEYSLNFIFIDEDGEIKQNCSMSQKVMVTFLKTNTILSNTILLFITFIDVNILENLIILVDLKSLFYKEV